jgi:hypothetical protein
MILKPVRISVVGYFDFRRSIEQKTPAQVATNSQKTKRLKNGSRLSGNTSS